jgi:hypothetical protein
MLLSIFSFRRVSWYRTGLRAPLLLLLILALVAMALEGACRLAVPRISRIEHRVVEEHRAVVASGNARAAGLQVIVLGNSLLEAGIRFDEARRLLSPEMDARRWVVHDTTYFDWYYGLRRLFAEGCRPDMVILVLTPGQLGRSKIRGNYFGYHLMRMADLFSVANDLGLSNTETSSLAFANMSAYFGLGAEIRKWLAGNVLQDLPQLTALMIQERTGPLVEEPIESISLERLRALRQLTTQHGAAFILVIPPTSGNMSETRCAATRRTGSLAGVSVLEPVPMKSLPIDYYADGFHLNSRGAEIFTRAFVEAIRKESGVACGKRAGPPGASGRDPANGGRPRAGSRS